MLSTLRAFAWLRWRLLLNSFERTASRDTVERFSLAAEKLGPIVAGILFIPSAIVLGIGSALAGHALGTDPQQAMLFEVVRFTLLAILVFSVVGPIILPSADRTNPVRMLLLPIPRRTMYVAQAAGALADPWVLLAVPVLVGVPAGLAAGGAFVAALVALAGGAALVVFIAGLATMSTSVMHLVARDRRRGEILALIFVMVFPVVALLPGLLADERGPRDGERRRTPLADRVPAWLGPAVEAGFRVVPSELYARTTRRSAQDDYLSAAAPLAGLTVAALLLNIAGMALYGRLLNTPASTSARRSGAMNELWTRSLPLLSPGASAVALGHVRLALRTPRGRGIMLTPLLMFGVLSGLMWHRGGALRFGAFAFDSGLALATFGAGVAMLSFLPIVMNQFAVDRAGLTLIMLSPLRVREYLAGKSAGNGILAGLPTLPIILVSILLFPSGSPALWAALLLGLLAVYLTVAPVAAIASAVFPRAVDMNSIGRGSNAHSAAGLIGLLAHGAAAVPPGLLTLAAVRWLDRPAMAPVLLLGWAVITLGINRALSPVVERIFTARRENLNRLIG